MSRPIPPKASLRRSDVTDIALKYEQMARMQKRLEEVELRRVRLSLQKRWPLFSRDAWYSIREPDWQMDWESFARHLAATVGVMLILLGLSQWFVGEFNAVRQKEWRNPFAAVGTNMQRALNARRQ